MARRRITNDEILRGSFDKVANSKSEEHSARAKLRATEM